MPLQRRIPKRGFKNPFRKEFAIINLERLSSWDVDEIKISDYREFGFVKNYKDGIKVLGDGELDRAMTVHAHKFSKSAREKIEKAGGTCVIVEA